MSILKSPNTFNDSGTLANVIYYKQFGQQLKRSVPGTYRDKNSTAQRDQRYAVFKPSLVLVRWLKIWVKTFFQIQPSGRSAFSTVMSMISVAFGGTELAPTFDPTDVLVGSGDLMIRFLTSAVKLSTSKITVVWPTDLSGPLDAATDLVSFVVTSEKGAFASVIATATARSVGTVDVVVPAILAGTRVWISSPIFVSIDSKKRSAFVLGDPVGSVDLT